MNVLKKMMMVMLVVVLCMGCTACSKEEEEPSNNLKNEERQETQTPTPQTPTPQAAESQKPSEEPTMDSNGDAALLAPYSYEIEGRNWNVEGITVKYPMLVNIGMLESGLAQKADKVNDLIMDDMSKLIETIQKNVDDKALTIDGMFEYAQISPEVLSIRYEIDYSAESLAYPVSLYHTLTISLSQDAVIPLSDLCYIDETFVEDYKTGWMYAPFRDLDLEAASVNIQEEIERQYSNEQLIKLFSQEDAQYYLAEQGLFISIGVPHVLGDHLEKAMKYEFLEVYMNRENPVWADYMFLDGDSFENTNEGEMTIEQNVKAGETFTITLNENLSTGYSWQYMIEDDTVVELESDRPLENGGTSDGVSEIEGSGSQHEWTFKGLSQGTTVISFDYMRSWEEQGTKAQALTYVITVE